MKGTDGEEEGGQRRKRKKEWEERRQKCCIINCSEMSRSAGAKTVGPLRAWFSSRCCSPPFFLNTEP